MDVSTRAAWAVAVASFVTVRLALMVVVPDPVEYNEFGQIADNMIAGRGFARTEVDGTLVPSSFMPPGYVFVVATAKWLGQMAGNQLLWVRAVNLAFQTAGFLLAGQLGSRLWHHHLAGAGGAALFAVVPPFAYAFWLPSSLNAYLVLDLAAVVAATSVMEDSSRRLRWIVLGVALGTLWLFRAEAPVLALLLVTLSAVRARGTVPRPRLLVSALAALGVATAIGAPWLLRNSLVHGEATYTMASTMGYNLYIGNGLGATGSQKSWSSSTELQTELRSLPPSNAYELRADQLYREHLIREVGSEPWRLVSVAAAKARMLLTFDPYDSRSQGIVQMAAFWTFAPLGTWSLWRAGRDRMGGRPAALAMIVSMAVTVLVIVVVFFLTRYRVNLEAYLAIAAGSWLASRRSPVQETSTVPLRSGC